VDRDVLQARVCDVVAEDAEARDAADQSWSQTTVAEIRPLWAGDGNGLTMDELGLLLGHARATAREEGFEQGRRQVLEAERERFERRVEGEVSAWVRATLQVVLGELDEIERLMRDAAEQAHDLRLYAGTKHKGAARPLHDGAKASDEASERAHELVIDRRQAVRKLIEDIAENGVRP
jgi:hypothetical protein